MTKDKVSSSIVSLEAMMLSCAIDAKERRYVMVTNIPGVFLHVYIEHMVHMPLDSTIVELILKLEASLYRKHLLYNQKGKLYNMSN